MRTKYTLTKNSVNYAIALTWLLSLAISIPDFVFTRVDPTNGECVSPLSPESNSVNATYVAVAISFYILLPFLVITFCYVQILRGMFITKTICAGPANGNSEKRKLAILIIAVTVVFYILFLPFGVFMLHVAFTKQSEGHEESGLELTFVKVLTFLIVANSSLNPILYAFQSENYRRGFRHLFYPRNSVVPLEHSLTLEEHGRIPGINISGT